MDLNRRIIELAFRRPALTNKEIAKKVDMSVQELQIFLKAEGIARRFPPKWAAIHDDFRSGIPLGMIAGERKMTIQRTKEIITKMIRYRELTEVE